MLNEREILSTLEMLKNENLDVRTVTLGINLFDCASDDPQRFQDNIRRKITGLARDLVAVCDQVGEKYGIPVVNKRISVGPIAVAAAPFQPDDMVAIAATLNDAAAAVKVDFIGGFSALVQKGIAPGDRALIEAIPRALTATERVCASINVASTRAGINMDAVVLMGRIIKEAAALTADSDGLACAKLCVFANIPQDIPFMAGAYLGVGEADTVINVGVSGPGVVKKALDRALESNPALDLGNLSEIIKKTSYKVTRVGELIGREVADILNIRFGVVDLSLAPTPNVGDSVGEIFQSLGLKGIGVPGTTAALALINDAVKKAVPSPVRMWADYRVPSSPSVRTSTFPGPRRMACSRWKNWKPSPAYARWVLTWLPFPAIRLPKPWPASLPMKWPSGSSTKKPLPPALSRYRAKRRANMPILAACSVNR